MDDEDFREIERERDDRLAEEAGEASSAAAGADPPEFPLRRLWPGWGYPLNQRKPAPPGLEQALALQRGLVWTVVGSAGVLVAALAALQAMA